MNLRDRLFESILLARQRVYEVGSATPLEEVKADLPFSLFVKREDLGPIKAYKWRGAYNRMAQLTPGERARGVVTASAGNHAQGVALAAGLLGTRARIYMPRPTPGVKQAAVRRFGGEHVEIVLHGDTYDAASEAATADAQKTGAVFVHPYDDLEVMAGQGTLADEVALSGKGPFDVAYLQIGGGGMAAAAACWLKRQYPGIRIIGVEGEDQAGMAAAVKAGSPIALPKVDIFCDGTAVKRVGTLTFELCRDLVDEYVTVSNEDVCWAIQTLWESNRIIPETSGALGVAAALKAGEALRGKRVLTVISGANIDFGKIGFITRNSHVGGARRHHLRVRIPERPDALLHLLEETMGDANIVEFQYGKCDAAEAWFVIGVAADGPALAALQGRLDAHRVAWQDVTGHEDVAFRVIRYKPELLAHPVFLNLMFFERAGALHDFLVRHVKGKANIAYFNYAYTGERVGRALIGLDFEAASSRETFLRELPATGGGFEACRVVAAPASARLLGE